MAEADDLSDTRLPPDALKSPSSECTAVAKGISYIPALQWSLGTLGLWWMFQPFEDTFVSRDAPRFPPWKHILIAHH